MPRLHKEASKFKLHCASGDNKTYECKASDLGLNSPSYLFPHNLNPRIRISEREIETEIPVHESMDGGTSTITENSNPVFWLTQKYSTTATFSFLKTQGETTPGVTLTEAEATLRNEILKTLTGKEGPFPHFTEEKFWDLTLTDEVAETNNVPSARDESAHNVFIRKTLVTLNTHFNILEQIAKRFGEETAS